MLFDPHAVISPITKDISIGGLLSYAKSEQLGQFQFVMNVAWEFTDYESGDSGPFDKDTLENGTVVHMARIDDVDDVDSVRSQEREILRAVGLLNEARARGERALVTCAAGRNRSALVIAEHLILVGGKPHEVVTLIQTARNRALNNNAFVRWLKRRR